MSDATDGIAPGTLERVQPVRRVGTEQAEPLEGIGLCLSGGGYRAMLFHVGALKRLNDAGLLHELARVSSVSGGSITAATLGLHWSELIWEGKVATNFDALVTIPIQGLAAHTLDVFSVVKGLLRPGKSISEEVAAAYRIHLFGDAQIGDLPQSPLFIINATNLESGALFRFTRDGVADWRVGTVKGAPIPLADAVAASSAFPPVLSPFELDLSDADWTTEPDNDPALSTPGFRDEVELSDGGVYDNLGLETVWKRCETVLVSDAGGHMGDTDHPSRLWPVEMLRVLQVIDNQVRDLRKQQTIASYELGLRKGTFWGIRGHTADYGLADALDFPPEEGARLAHLPTRLAELGDHDQQQLINWGYVICDTAIRRWVEPAPPRPTVLPYPD